MRTAVAACLIALAACSPAAAATRSFPVAGFDRVRNTLPYDVHVRTGAAFGAVANGDGAVLDQLDLRVQGGELVMRMRPGNWRWNNQRAAIEVTMPAARGLALDGPGNIVADHLANRAVTLTLSGPGNIRVDRLEAAMLDVRLDGPGNIDAAGRVERMRVVANGPGDARLARIAARDIDVSLNGPGNVDATASGDARLVLQGPGDIRVGGRPRCRIEKHGPGDVRCG